MKNRIDRIKEERKLKGLKWADLAKDLPVSGEAVRVAFYRNSIDPLYLERIEETLGFKKRTESTSKKSESGFEEVVAVKVLEHFGPTIKNILESHQQSKDALNRLSILTSMLMDKVEELEEKVSFMEEMEKAIFQKVNKDY